jgi:hypothetical protein
VEGLTQSLFLLLCPQAEEEKCGDEDVGVPTLFDKLATGLGFDGLAGGGSPDFVWGCTLVGLLTSCLGDWGEMREFMCWG